MPFEPQASAQGRQEFPIELSTCGRFSKELRVRRRKDFLRVQRSAAIRIRTRSFTVVAKNVGESVPRLGCVVSKRVGQAVTRNRVRRLIREIFRRLQERLEARDYIVIASPAAASTAQAGLAAMAAELVPALLQAAGSAGKRGRRT